MTHQEGQDFVRSIRLAALRTETVLNRETCEIAHKNACSLNGPLRTRAMIEFQTYVHELRAGALKEWINTYLIKELAEMSLEELRILGQRHKIVYYYRLTKDELVREIQRERDRAAKSIAQRNARVDT